MAKSCRFKGFVLPLSQPPDPPLYVLNHGVSEGGLQNALRILTSTDLVTWRVRDTSRPDPKW